MNSTGLCDTIWLVTITIITITWWFILNFLHLHSSKQKMAFSHSLSWLMWGTVCNFQCIEINLVWTNTWTWNMKVDSISQRNSWMGVLLWHCLLHLLRPTHFHGNWQQWCQGTSKTRLYYIVCAAANCKRICMPWSRMYGCSMYACMSMFKLK